MCTRSPSPKTKRAPGHCHRLLAKTAEVDLDAAFGLIVEGVVREGVEIERRVQLAIHASQQIERKGRRDAGRIVVGIVQPLRFFL